MTETYLEEPPDYVDISKDKWMKLSYDTQYYYANEERQKYIKNKNHENRKNRQKWFKNIKEEIFCQVCGESEPCVLDFHHQNEEPEFRVGNMAGKGYSREKIIKEMEKCAVVCANCHRKIHAEKIDVELSVYQHE